MKYFLHDTNAFQDEKIAELFIAHGYEGLGLFYSILEKLGYQEKPVKTAVLKKQLSVGKKLEKCWLFLESLQLISSNNGETFNDNLLKFSEKYQVSKEKNRERVAQWREKQADTKPVTHYESVRNGPKVKIIKDKISTSNEVHAANAAVSEPEKKRGTNLQPENPPADASHTRAATDVPTRKGRAAKQSAAELTGPLAAALNVGGVAQEVQSLKKPLTQPEADALVAEFGATAALQIVQEMANYTKLSSYNSVNLTARNWLSKRTTSPKQPHASPANPAQPSRYHTAHHAGGFGSFGGRPPGGVASQPVGVAGPGKGAHPLPGPAN